MEKYTSLQSRRTSSLIMRLLFTAIILQPIWLSAQSNTTSLKEKYKYAFPIGVAVSMPHLTAQEGLLLKEQIASLTAENAMKPSSILKSEGVYDYAQADRIARFARENGMKLRGHTLVWHQQTPEWFFKDKTGNDLDSTQLYDRLREYMQEVMGHFKDDVYCWDVVNEAISDKKDEMYRSEKSAWYRICKENFIEKAFRLAREINPKVKLFYNDYNLTNPAKREKTYRMLKLLKEKGVPIDGVGMQGHWKVSEIKADEIQKSIDMFSSLGLDVQITELDLSIYKNDNKQTIPFTAELEQQQSDAYQTVFEVLYKNRDKITGVTFWGLADNRTWLDNFPVKNRKDYPLLFDVNLKPKKAYHAIMNL